MKKTFLFFVLLTVAAVSCKRNSLKVDTAGIQVDLKIGHLDVDLMKLKPEEMEAAIPELKKKYGEFFDIFTYQMIAVGGTEQPNFAQMLNSFVGDTMIVRLKTNVAQKIDTIAMRGELESAFKYFRHYFPEKPIPTVYTCLSGFNQSVVIAENLIGVSLEKYMGVQSPYYKGLGIPAYKRRNMHPDRMVIEMMLAWADAEWPKPEKENSLFSNMIQQGKVQYFIDALFPEASDTLKMGYTKEQLNFCRENEAKMWTYMAEHKMLFTTDRMSIKRFIDDAPYTSSFSEQSPGRTGAWLGWQIVRAYMKAHPETKLPALMSNQNFQEILNQSGYQP